MATVSLMAIAQGGTLSPYSQYGLGEMAPQGGSVNRAMNGLGIALHGGTLINPVNPASFASVDSLTMLFDMGVSGQISNFNENGTKTNAKGANFEYVMGSFRAYKNVGVAFGVLPLTNVDWQVTATALVGEDLVPSMYQAVATYSATGNYNAPVGYVTTASYTGTVTDAGIENIVYTVVFTGEPIQPIETVPPSPPPEEVQPTEIPVETASPVERTQRSEDGFNIWSILGAVPLLLFVAVLIILILRQKNVLVYVPGDKPKEYRLVGKYRASARIPRIDIGNINPRPDGIVAVEIKQSLAKKLLGRDFTVRCGNREYTYRVRRDQPSDWHEYNIETLEEVQN